MKRTRNLWTSLEALPAHAGVLADWRQAMGGDFEAGRFYLIPSGRLSTCFPCNNKPSCGCYHEVNPHAAGDIYAVCHDPDSDCPPIRLQPEDLILYSLNFPKLGDSIRRAFGFHNVSIQAAQFGPASLRIGTYGHLHNPVYFYSPHDEGVFLREIEGLLNGGGTPFILVSPTRDYCTATVEATIARGGCLLISCSVTLSIEAGGFLRVTNPIDSLLTVFNVRQTQGTALAKTVETIGQDLHAVATNTYELRRENEELKVLAEGGFLRFATRVDAKDFQAFAAIMLMGNRNQAAEALNIPSRSFYDLVNTWAHRGPDYKRMFRMSDWRKKQGRKIKVRLDDSLLGTESQDQPENPETIQSVLLAMRDKEDMGSQEDLLRDILNALESQNPTNWQDVQSELIEILREEIPQ